MAWSAENATNAFIQTVKTVTNTISTSSSPLPPLVHGDNNVTGPDTAQFVSALAAGRGARLLVEACGGTAGPTTLGLIAAASQTGGRVVCIVPGPDELRAAEESLGTEAGHVELVVGDAQRRLMSEYRGADFVLVDCSLGGHAGVFRAAQASAMAGAGGLVVGYNASKTKAWPSGGGLRVATLPIEDGLRLCRVPPGVKRSSQWVALVDERTGEEHVFRVTMPRRKLIQA